MRRLHRIGSMKRQSAHMLVLAGTLPDETYGHHSADDDDSEVKGLLSGSRCLFFGT